MKLLSVALLLPACHPQAPTLTPCGIAAWGVTRETLNRAEAAATQAFPLTGFTPEEVCQGLAGLTIYTREAPWMSDGKRVLGVYHSASHSIEVGFDLRALGHELFHAVDQRAGWGNPGDGHALWPERKVPEALQRFEALR